MCCLIADCLGFMLSRTNSSNSLCYSTVILALIDSNSIGTSYYWIKHWLDGVWWLITISAQKPGVINDQRMYIRDPVNMGLVDKE